MQQSVLLSVSLKQNGYGLPLFKLALDKLNTYGFSCLLSQKRLCLSEKLAAASYQQLGF